MAIQQGDKVKVAYTGTLDDGTVFDSSDGREPLQFEAGAGQLIKGFDDAVIGMEVGEEKNITIPSAQAYGDHNPELVRKVSRDLLPADAELESGMLLGVTTPDGRQMPATVVDVSEQDITLDLNHQLAGKTLHFSIKVAEIAPKETG